MVGSNNRTCIRSRWTGQKPHCYGLNQENDYASECRLQIHLPSIDLKFDFSGKSTDGSVPISEWPNSAEQRRKTHRVSGNDNSHGVLVDATIWHTKVECYS